MQYTFLPIRRNTIFVYSLVSIGLVIIAGVSIERASQANDNALFLSWIIVFLTVATPFPVLMYRLYTLIRAAYLVEANGVRLTWGLRVEEIPMNQIAWVSLGEHLSHPLPVPRLHLPGILSGVRQISANETVEYMATTARDLVIIATKKRYFAISPEDPIKFVDTFERVAELGSLTPISAQSIYEKGER